MQVEVTERFDISTEVNGKLGHNRRNIIPLVLVVGDLLVVQRVNTARFELFDELKLALPIGCWGHERFLSFPHF